MSVSRRGFCQTGLAALAGTFSSACSRETARRPARRIPGEIRAVTLDGDPIAVEGAAVSELAASLEGMLLLPGETGYDGARRIWNGMHDRRPALIVRARSSSDVAHAVTFAADRRLLLAVKGGGHSWPGRSVADDALMIDLSELRSVLVDPHSRRARVGGGALIYDLDIASLAHDLVTTGGIVSHTGVGGLTLGGGYGRLGRRFGLAIDNLVSAELVTADGTVRRVSADEDADLFWAIRGGGGNFGVVTGFEFALHAAPPVMYGGVIQWALPRARDVLEYYAEHAPDFSNAMFAGPGLVTGPDGAVSMAVDICYCGALADAERELAPLRAVARPAFDGAGPASYLTMQTRMDGIARPGIRSYIKSGMVASFTPGLIDSMLEAYVPGSGVVINSFATGGAIAGVDETATAWPHRNAQAMVAALSFWPDPHLDDQRISATRDLWSALDPHTGGYYANIQADDIEVASNYGPVFDRLVAIKRQYDPLNLFRLNSNIPPGP